MGLKKNLVVVTWNGGDEVPYSHVHFDLDLGKISSLDDFYSGSVAAAYGGVTTFIDFLEPVSNAKDLETAFYKRLEQAKDSVIDYKFHACLKNPKNDYTKRLISAVPVPDPKEQKIRREARLALKK